MLIDAEWCTLFRDWKVGVGVSLDGPRDLHDANRKTRSGGGTFDKTIAGIRMLKVEQLPFHVISVLSANTKASTIPTRCSPSMSPRHRPRLLQCRGRRQPRLGPVR